MLLDPRPKAGRKDLFDQEDILEELYRSIDHLTIVLTGIRRFWENISVQSISERDQRSTYYNRSYGVEEELHHIEIYILFYPERSPQRSAFKEILQHAGGVRIACFDVELS